MDIYTWADRSINACPRYGTGFTALLSADPYRLAPVVRLGYHNRLSLIRSFQQTSIQLFRAAVNNDLPPVLLHWLINETPACMGIEYHRKLETRHFTAPVFFRTDEVSPGRIAEIQCPGSLWGELQLVFEYAGEMGVRSPGESPANQFGSQLTRLLNDVPVIHHLLDNASAPAGMRYFIEMTRPNVRYWGIDRGVKVADCNFVRSHSFFGLWAENEFHARLSRVGSGITYDLPPNILFDQKATLVLPFWSITRDCYSDAVREMLLFSSPLLPSGVELPDGSCETIEAFSQRPRSRRSFYAKYAGSSVALNWGSKAVYRLSNMSSKACLDFLRTCLSGFERGQIWLLQEEGTQDDEITYLDRNGSTITQTLRAKLSGFYGPEDCIGVLAMHRHHNKVHGQENTVLSYVSNDSQDAAQG